MSNRKKKKQKSNENEDCRLRELLSTDDCPKLPTALEYTRCSVPRESVDDWETVCPICGGSLWDLGDFKKCGHCGQKYETRIADYETRLTETKGNEDTNSGFPDAD